MVPTTRRRLLCAPVVGLLASGCLGSLGGSTSPEKRLVGTYREGTERADQATTSLREGETAYENGELVFAASDSGSARELFSRAAGSFGEARDIASDLDEGDAVDICEEAERKVTVLESAAGHLRTAAKARRDDDGRAETHFDRFQSAREEASNFRIRTVSVLENAIGGG